jgi:hypothetical protein
MSRSRRPGPHHFDLNGLKEEARTARRRDEARYLRAAAADPDTDEPAGGRLQGNPFHWD